MAITRRGALALMPLGLRAAADWPSFRGPRAGGISEGKPLPVNWDISAGKQVRWRTDIPGMGFSSPVIVNGRIYLTTAIPETPVSYNRRADSGNDQVKHDWQLMAVDAASGKVLWKQTARQGVPRIKRHGKASHANATPAADGARVAAFFGSEGLYVYDTAGKLVWKKDLGLLTVGLKNDLTSEWSFSSSPVLYRNMVIVQCDTNRDDFVAAFDVNSGKELWRSTREEYPAWSTPLIVETPRGVQVVTTSPRFTRGLDIATGREIWRFADETEVKTPAPIAAHGLIFISGGYPSGRNFFALNMDGTLAWRNEKGGPYVPTPIVYGDYLYIAGDAGIAGCYDAKTGREVYRERIAPGVAFSASPVAGDGKIYLSSEEGDIYILRAGPKFEVMAKRPFGEALMATPAIADGVLYVRSFSKLYAIA